MALARLQVADFRCLRALDLEFDPGFTLISGENASGKTSLLEAIYLLGRGRSFRTRRLEHLMRRGAGTFTVAGQIEHEGRLIPAGVEGTRQGLRARVGAEPVASLADLAVVLPVQIIDPEVHKLIEEGPVRRRRFLDWGVFHVEPGFVDNWQHYQQALRQRNAALKSGQPRPVVQAWDAELLRYGAELAEARGRYVERLSEPAYRISRALLGGELRLSYRCGWNRELSFAEALAQSWILDSERRATQCGPHRADLVVQLDGVGVRDHVSRGQQKLLAAALLIAQISLFPAEAAVQPTLLLDDPAAELDSERLRRLILEVGGARRQLVVTTLQADFAAFGIPGKRYQLERGGLRIS